MVWGGMRRGMDGILLLGIFESNLEGIWGLRLRVCLVD